MQHFHVCSNSFHLFFFRHFQKGWVLVRVILKKLVGDCVLTVVKCNALFGQFHEDQMKL